MQKDKLYKETKSAILLITMLFLIAVLSYFVANFPWMFLSILGVSILLPITISILNSYLNMGFLEKLNRWASVPLAIIYGVLTVVIPFWTVPVHLLLYFIIASSIPLTIYKVIIHFGVISSADIPAAIYLLITSIVFTSVLFNDLIRYILYRMSPVRVKSSQKLKAYGIEELTDYFLSIDVVRFCVYSGYVVFLLLINFSNLRNGTIYESKEIDKAIIQSFVTFIAIDRVVALAKSLPFSPSELLDKLKASVIRKVEEESTSENGNLK